MAERARGNRMREVWLVYEITGDWSDFYRGVESIWDSEAGAVSHIVRDIGAEFDPSWRSGLQWVVRGADFDDWDGDDEGPVPDYEDVTYEVERALVRHGG